NGACAFKTITKAISVVGTSAVANTKIIVLGTSTVSLAANGETFPLVVPTNVTISSQGGTVTVKPTAAGAGFTMNSASSGLTDLTIDGQVNTATQGVSIGNGGTVTLNNVIVQNFLNDGIRVSGSGQVTINAGTKSTGNGAGLGLASGLHL